MVVGGGAAKSSRRLMGSEAVKCWMHQHLLSCGLNDKKLSVFMPNDADVIASQICTEIGVVCEQKHVDAMADLIKEVKFEEPLQKRLRGDISLDPMH